MGNVCAPCLVFFFEIRLHGRMEIQQGSSAHPPSKVRRKDLGLQASKPTLLPPNSNLGSCAHILEGVDGDRD